MFEEYESELSANHSIMSISENSTLLARNGDNEGAYQLSDDGRYNSGPTVNAYEKSPYTDPDFVTLDVGPSHTLFRVHRIVLSQSPELDVKPFSRLWGDKTTESILLPDLDDSTAHTLVHYLYSGRYQTLHAHDLIGGTLAAYTVGTCVYVASIRYKLPGLADLAKEQINVSSEDLSILEILSVARDKAFPGLAEEEVWYVEYLEAVILKAFRKDKGFFMTGEFVDLLEGAKRFKQVVMKAVIQGTMGGSRVEEVVEQRREETPALEESEGVEIESLAVEEEVVQEQEQEQEAVPASRTPSPEPQPRFTSTAQPEEDAGIVLDAIEPTPSPSIEPEPFTDEVGFKSSQTYLQQFSRTSSTTEPPTTFPVTKRPSHERFDSLVQGVDDISLQQLSETDDLIETPIIETDELVVAMPDNTVTEVSPLEELEKLEAEADVPVSPAAKKNRRKKNKKNAAAAAAAAATTAAAGGGNEVPVIANGAVAAWNAVS